MSFRIHKTCTYPFQSAGVDSAELKIAKVAVTAVILWAAAWTPYAVVMMIQAFGDRSLITPMVAQIPSILTKTASSYNPFVFAISHPKYREELAKRFPKLGIGEVKNGGNSNNTEMTPAN